MDILELFGQMPGIRAVSVPWKRLGELYREQEAWARGEMLSPSQEKLLAAKMPSLDFAPQSLLVLAAPLKLVDMVFHAPKREIVDMNALFVPGFPENVQKLLADHGYRVGNLTDVPLKRLAACAGLGFYGRNNLIIVPPWGSFVALAALASDLPAREDSWRPQPPDLPECVACGLCVQACPTGAIRPERFLLDNERCMTFAMQNTQGDLPAWVPKKAVNHLSGCMICQKVCPQNRAMLAPKRPRIEIDRDETALLLQNGELPPELLRKLDDLELGWMLSGLARNLAALMDAKNQ